MDGLPFSFFFFFFPYLTCPAFGQELDPSWEVHDLEGTTFTFLAAERKEAAKGRPQKCRTHFES